MVKAFEENSSAHAKWVTATLRTRRQRRTCCKMGYRSRSFDHQSSAGNLVSGTTEDNAAQTRP